MLRHTPGLKGPSPRASVAYGKIYKNREIVCFLFKCKHFGNTFINIVGFLVYLDIRGNVQGVMSTVSICIPD